MDNCPTLRVHLTWALWLRVSVQVQCFRCPLVQRRMCFFPMKIMTLSSKLWGSTLSSSTCGSIALRQVSGTTLMYAALTMAMGVGSFRDCRANSLTNFLITFSKWKDSAIWVGRFNSWSWLAMAVVGESVLNFSCCLGSRHVSHRRTSAFNDHFDYCFIVHLNSEENLRLW